MEVVRVVETCNHAFGVIAIWVKVQLTGPRWAGVDPAGANSAWSEPGSQVQFTQKEMSARW